MPALGAVKTPDDRFIDLPIFKRSLLNRMTPSFASGNFFCR